MSQFEWIILFFIGHFLGDFVFQSSRLALGKSKSNWILFEHVSIYTYVLCLVLLIGWSILTASAPPPFCIVWISLFNGATHFMTDWSTSRITSSAYKHGNMTKFWRTIGLDQMIHGLWFVVSVHFLAG